MLRVREVSVSLICKFVLYISYIGSGYESSKLHRQTCSCNGRGISRRVSYRHPYIHTYIQRTLGHRPALSITPLLRTTYIHIDGQRWFVSKSFLRNSRIFFFLPSFIFSLSHVQGIHFTHSLCLCSSLNSVCSHNCFRDSSC